MTRKHPAHDTHTKGPAVITEFEFYTQVMEILDDRAASLTLRQTNDKILALAAQLTIYRDARNRQTLQELVAARQKGAVRDGSD